MLSKQLLITTFRDGKARPFFLEVNPKHLELATALVHLFQDSLNRRRFEIEERIKTFNIEKVNPKVVQGLADLLYKRSSFDDLGGTDVVENRQQIFYAAAHYWKNTAKEKTDFLQHRKNILKIAKVVSPGETVEEYQLFGDILANQTLKGFEAIQPEKLIHRFNISQVQGLFLNSRSLELRIHRRTNSAFKQLMQMMKFFRLMFELKSIENDWITMAIDGPGAVLEHSRSYGIEIAKFFPAILLLNVPWQLTASLKVPNRRQIFTLEITEDNPYQSHYPTRNAWTHEKNVLLLERLNEKYAEKYRAFSDQEIIILRDNQYLLPDFLIMAVDAHGIQSKNRQVRFEWIHYPSGTKLKWIQKIKSQLPDNYVFAVKGKPEKLKSLVKMMGKHLLVYANNLTAPAVIKKVEDNTENSP
ncbi:MAG: DUF790 family protein [SAR324 cluster bacterium]|nr:DUF790 family protein [SAR324 cluster bacterium]